MEDQDFTKAIDETVNYFMSHAAQQRPEMVFDLAMAVFMNLLTIIPYPVMKVAEKGGDFPENYRELIMELMPEFTVELRGQAAEFIQTIIQRALDKGMVMDGQFEFMGRQYPHIPEPPTDATN